ncbi:hypothetical protein AOQ84DRAFT_142975 [Glonium stellatum]|uniref:Uncharacterized protein n=1 Tax=Glonium stellatum TaxID=574774 RepID=A0A8E2F943_9PEZI|nr:hypothetical protein AOQ84DRAFT_142975 [Glonium stellatum]
MQYVAALLALAAIAKGSPFPQGVSMAIPPKASAPAGCSSSYSGSFGIAVVSITSSSNIISTTIKSIIPITTSAPGITPTTVVSSTAYSAAPVSQTSE